MAWPKGRRKGKDGLPSPDIGSETEQILGHPIASEATLAAPPTEPEVSEADAIRRKIMLHRLQGPASKLPWKEWREIRFREDMRDAKLVEIIKVAMFKATPDQAEAYLDVELARR